MVLYKTGWIPDIPDLRDFSPAHPQIAPLLEKAGVQDQSPLPRHVDLRPWCTPVENQGSLGACTAHAAAGLVEYFEKKSFGKYTDASRLFIYKVTRNLLGYTGDTGAPIRTTMGALVLFGAPPERHWPYDISRFDEEPSAFCYSYAQNYQSMKYFRLDMPGLPKVDLLQQLRKHLAAGIPVMFGFTLYSSAAQAGTDGMIPYPSGSENVIGAHAVVAVGYDDDLKITNSTSKKAAAGALLLRNSWGTDWGQGGYGWLPYAYVLKSLSSDFWSVLSNEWVDSSQFYT